jgi:hypothetical protein
VVDLTDNTENAERELLPPQGGHTLLLPDWLPDGERIAFHEVVGIEGLGPLGVANIDGSSYTV